MSLLVGAKNGCFHIVIADFFDPRRPISFKMWLKRLLKVFVSEVSRLF